MSVRGRRDFLKQSSALLGGIAASSVAADNARAASRATTGPAVAAFGWDVSNLNGNGADVYFEVLDSMTLNSINIDAAFVIGSSSPQNTLAEVLCTAGVSRGAVPTFNNTGGHAYFNSPSSTNFGSVTVYNPNGLSVGANGVLSQDQFYAVVLRSWVPSGGAASSTYRQVLANSSLSLNVGDYLVFHMDHAGSICDCQMQVVLQYTLG